MDLKIKRVYEPAARGDGFRVLVDRLWPRGLSKERAAVDLWAKDVAPSDALRKAFHHDDLAWPDFADRYRAELAGAPALDELRRAVATHPTTTLLYGAHDDQHNQAVVLQRLLTDAA